MPRRDSAQGPYPICWAGVLEGDLTDSIRFDPGSVKASKFSSWTLDAVRAIRIKKKKTYSTRNVDRASRVSIIFMDRGCAWCLLSLRMITGISVCVAKDFDPFLNNRPPCPLGRNLVRWPHLLNVLLVLLEKSIRRHGKIRESKGTTHSGLKINPTQNTK
jgi:hypothetical protein